MKFQVIFASALLQLASSIPIDADGESASGGFLTGNVIQIPIDIPANICGNSVDVIAGINPALANNCVNFNKDFQIAYGTPIEADGKSQSPGAVSGNVIQIPASIPVNFCGNTINVIGALNPAFGNNCENTSDHV
ncbi:DUF320-domain-containing protein [Conidiobolus coronatus NRRL 28638]|uniref:DUF320-domain-containing protein n=1 Tax=Conidiobolus coronatus (strain ATCC 28846 / CBS 209.66 / NRRL 28638) TaxID=796925 RepID=A0A137NWS7_CONC2|nr:DUF320-domain-containing protein [Conidiobolus coronatus NRRL 28638]|eukprot:KXN67273.1 DUF320-domain-containing protein [Conidiobolus coronatus NRRL 28638]